MRPVITCHARPRKPKPPKPEAHPARTPAELLDALHGIFPEGIHRDCFSMQLRRIIENSETDPLRDATTVCGIVYYHRELSAAKSLSEDAKGLWNPS